ncbi:MAG: hypothetical protein LBS55_14235 [Prevotellaceae bacterium]|nr:hypothetical protein [Prevotellaceae bacterium]
MESVDFCNDLFINILGSKKSGEWIFSKYRKDTLTGLISTHKDSIVFSNDIFFSTQKTEYQQFKFIDSLKIEFITSQKIEDKTVDYRYIFCFDNLSNKWLLSYAEKRTFTSEQSIYLFTDHFQQNLTMDNFSEEKYLKTLFTNVNGTLYYYKYKKNNYLDSIEIQVSKMRSAGVTSFKNIFTIDHAEEIIQNYPVTKTTVISLNNIAYYLEQMSIAIPAIAILETVIDDYPNRTISYVNLGDALTKNNLKIKAEKMYKQYYKMTEISNFTVH